MMIHELAKTLYDLLLLLFFQLHALLFQVSDFTFGVHQDTL